MRRRDALAAMVVALSAPAGFAFAGPQDYRFELVGRPAKVGGAVRFAVRLIRVPGGLVVTGATIAPIDFNMSPEGMAGSNPVSILPMVEPGVQPFEVTPDMPGRWELLLEGRVVGEPDTIKGRLVVAVPE